MFTDGAVSATLNYADLPVIGNGECASIYPGYIQWNTLCTSSAGGSSTCSGDAGGPLVAWSNNRNILVCIILDRDHTFLYLQSNNVLIIMFYFIYRSAYSHSDTAMAAPAAIPLCLPESLRSLAGLTASCINCSSQLNNID